MVVKGGDRGRGPVSDARGRVGCQVLPADGRRGWGSVDAGGTLPPASSSCVAPGHNSADPGSKAAGPGGMGLNVRWHTHPLVDGGEGVLCSLGRRGRRPPAARPPSDPPSLRRSRGRSARGF